MYNLQVRGRLRSQVVHTFPHVLRVFAMALPIPPSPQLTEKRNNPLFLRLSLYGGCRGRYKFVGGGGAQLLLVVVIGREGADVKCLRSAPDLTWSIKGLCVAVGRRRRMCFAIFPPRLSRVFWRLPSRLVIYAFINLRHFHELNFLLLRLVDHDYVTRKHRALILRDERLLTNQIDFPKSGEILL